jgi:ferric-dicitrate binding protein FerR (iron transport regulator)
LNSASSITYPTAFVGNQRNVKITGEVYFEVAKNPKMPFKVRINDQSEVEVLGTHFNINAYQDESVIKTTLLEGAVKITKGSEVAFIDPGQQAQVAPMEKIKIVKDADIDKVMAWKNGLFNFEGLGIEEVMRQLSRWYDIDIVYEEGVPNIKFVGELSKNVTLTDLLSGLNGIGVHFKIEQGRRLVIQP